VVGEDLDVVGPIGPLPDRGSEQLGRSLSTTRRGSVRGSAARCATLAPDRSEDLMTTNAPLLAIDDGPLAAALRRLHHAERDADGARQAVADAKDALGVVLHAVAAPYRIGLDELPVDLIETLYWDEPAVRVRDLASAFGLRMKTLRDLVGTRTVTVTCSECGVATELVRRSRSDARRAPCDDCRFRAVMRGALAPRWDDHADGWLDPRVGRADPRGYVDEARRRGLLDPEVEKLEGPWQW
jgi:hypothetical protein